MSDSALKQAHDEIVETARQKLDLAYRKCEGQLVPIDVPLLIMAALRELDRMEGQGRDWAEMERSLTEAVNDAEGRLEEEMA